MAPSTVTTVESLVSFGLQIFLQVFSMFRHPTNPVPVEHAPVIAAGIMSTPGLSEDQKTHALKMVSAASVAAGGSPVQTNQSTSILD